MKIIIALLLSFLVLPAYSATKPVALASPKSTKQFIELNRMLMPQTFYPPVVYETVRPGAAPLYTTRNVAAGAATVSRAIGTALARSTPYGLAALAAIEAIDLLYDPVTDTWTGDGNPVPDSPLGHCNRTGGGSNNADLATCYDRYTAQGQIIEIAGGSSIPGRLLFRNQSGTSIGHWTGPTNWTFPEPLPFTPEAASDLTPAEVISRLPADVVSGSLQDALSDPDPYHRWPALRDVADDLDISTAPEDEGTRLPKPNIYDFPDGSSGGGGSELPPFCDWVPDWLCNLMDLPEHPEVPYVEIDAPDDFESGVGAGQCPADVIISTQFGSVPISWQYPCELATTFKPVVLFFAWIAALYIVVRVR